jgi:phosphohistidine phosphatase
VTLYVLRHGIAEDSAPDGDDASRRLTPRGRKRVYAAAIGMRAMGLRFDLILTSPFARAHETAAVVAEVYGGDPPPREFPPLAQGVPAVETVRALRPLARQSAILVVGHEPGLSGMVSYVLSGSPEAIRIDLKKSGLVALEVHDLGRRAGATLSWMLTPRQLRALRRS